MSDALLYLLALGALLLASGLLGLLGYLVALVQRRQEDPAFRASPRQDVGEIRRLIAQVLAEMQTLRGPLTASTAAWTAMEQRLQRLEGRLNQIREPLDASQAEPMTRTLLDIAAKLSRRGSNAEDLVRFLGLTPGQAELIRRLNSESSWVNEPALVAEPLPATERPAAMTPPPAPLDPIPPMHQAASLAASLTARDHPSAPAFVPRDPSKDPAKDPETMRQIFDTAARLSRQGSGAGELVELFGLTPGEAELIRQFHTPEGDNGSSREPPLP